MSNITMKRKRASGVVEEPSTLVYTLLDANELPFEQFSLIVRSLHTYMVEDIVQYPDSKTIHVKLGFQASVANACKKLGNLDQVIAITKLSSFVTDNELPLLDQLKRKYGFGLPNEETETPVQVITQIPKRPSINRYRSMPTTSAQIQGEEHM